MLWAELCRGSSRREYRAYWPSLIDDRHRCRWSYPPQGPHKCCDLLRPLPGSETNTHEYVPVRLVVRRARCKALDLNRVWQPLRVRAELLDISSEIGC